MSNVEGYSQIRTDFLTLYWRGCAGRRDGTWDHSMVMSWTIDELFGSYDLEIERLMFCVVGVGLCDSWTEDVASYLLATARRTIDGFGGQIPFHLLSERDADELA